MRHVTQAELEALEDMPVAIMYPLDDEGVATHNAAPVLNAGEQCELPAEVVAGLPADIVAALQGVQAAYNALPESDHGSFRAEIQKFIDAAIKQLCMPGGGAKPKRPDAYRFLDEKRAGRRRPARVAAYHAMDALLALGWPSARRPPPWRRCLSRLNTLRRERPRNRCSRWRLRWQRRWCSIQGGRQRRARRA